MQAARMAGIGKVALMQEPVAAVMSVMRGAHSEGIFLIYDLGGGTFDVSIAENIKGKVNLLAHGGIEMCGGRDMDRMIFNQVVIPWLLDNFSLPEDFIVNRKYKTFCRVAQWAAEQAKIELSANGSSTIALSESEARTSDEDGNELYLDIDLSREMMDGLIGDLVEDTVKATRETLEKAGLSANDLERIVFVGGPTNYKPLRDRVCEELALPADIDVNPMTAVAEGASIFAESIDWSTANHSRKAANAVARTNVDIAFKYTARVSGDSARVMCMTEHQYDGYTLIITSRDSGWSSGSIPLRNQAQTTLPLIKNGENTFDVKVLDNYGREVPIGVQRIVITKTLATIGAIPASHSIGVEMLDRLGGIPVYTILIHEGDSLPKRDTVTFRAGQTLKAGSNSTINIKLWEGNIESPITDNRFIGVLKIAGTDFSSGVIPTGADIECEYEMSDSGTITLDVSVPCIGASFTNRNFYSRQEGQIDLNDVDDIAEHGQQVLDRIERMEERLDDPQLEEARRKAENAATIDQKPLHDPEDVQKVNNDLLDAKKIMNQVRIKNLKTIRQMDLDSCRRFFDEVVRQYAKDNEAQSFDNLVRSAQRSIDRNDADFDNILENLKTKNTIILLRQDWFVVDWYKRATASGANYLDVNRFHDLKRLGDQAMANDDMDKLRQVLFELLSIKIDPDHSDSMFDVANIIRR